MKEEGLWEVLLIGCGKGDLWRTADPCLSWRAFTRPTWHRCV